MSGQPPVYEGLLDNIKNANTIYESQRQRILSLESAYLASQNQALELTYAYKSCREENEKALELLRIRDLKEEEYKGIIKQHEIKETIYQTVTGTAIVYLLYNLIFKR